jgi:hypothetical protein
MQEGRGFDDPAFYTTMLSLYDQEYGTNYYDSVTKYHGSVGTLEFRGEKGTKIMQEMIEKARQEVTNNRQTPQ